MGSWRTRDQIVAALMQGQTVGYGCGCPGVPIRVFQPGDELKAEADGGVPAQATIDANEATCDAYGMDGSGGITADQATSIATSIAVDQRQQATAQLTPLLEVAQQDAADALATAQAAARAITAAIPVAVMTVDYQAKSDDQRIAHDSAGNHTLTPLPMGQAVNRRFVFSNGYRGGLLTLAGTYVTPTADGSAMVANPVLIPGASVDVICRFALDPAGNDTQPSDLRVDGSPAATNTPGRLVWDIVSRNFGGGNALAFNQLQEDVMSYTRGSKNRGTWTAAPPTPYSPGDTVQYGNPVSTYQATAANVGQSGGGGTPASDNSNANWTLYASAGATGTAGLNASQQYAAVSLTAVGNPMASPAAGTFRYDVEYVLPASATEKLCARQTGLASVLVKNNSATATLTVTPPTGSAFDNGNTTSDVLPAGDERVYTADPSDSTSWVVG